MATHPTYRQHQRSAGRIIEGQAFVLSPDNKLHTLNSTGTEVWKLAEHPRTIEELAGAVAQRFDVDEERARADMELFCDDLVRRQVLEVHG